MGGVGVGRVLGVESLEPGKALIGVLGFSSPSFMLLCLQAFFHLLRLPSCGSAHGGSPHCCGWL